jgi:hypothetical protein
MDSTTPRIDAATNFTFELRNRRQNATDDAQQDLFAQALGQQLANNQDQTAPRATIVKGRATDRTAKSQTPGKAPARDPRPAETSPVESVSRETVSGKKSLLSSQVATAKANPGTQPTANAKTTTENVAVAGKADKAEPDGKCTTETAVAADDETASAAPGDDAKTATANTSTDKAASTVTDANAATPTAEVTVQTNVPVTPATPVAQTTVLLLSGLPSGEDGAPADPIASDPQALAALLAKFPGNPAAAAAPKGANTPAPQQNDPNAIDGENPDTIGQAKPSEPAPADRAGVGTAKTKIKTNGQNAALREQADAVVKPAMPEQASLTVLAQATTGTGRAITLPEGMGVTEEGEIGASDLEFSAWSDQLGPGLANGLGRANLQQSAFLAQLKQNVQLMQPHEQVAVQMQRAAQNGVGRLTVDLQPAELGRVEIKMSVDKDKNVTASVVVDRPATLDLLQRDARNLERILQDAGLQTDSGSLSFSLRNSGGDAQGQNQGGTGTGNRGQSGGNDAAATPSAAARPTVVATADGYVDLET